MDFIKDLDQSDLQMIEIKKKGHQKKLLLAVQRLSDVELTAELDKVVEGQFCQHIIKFFRGYQIQVLFMTAIFIFLKSFKR